MTDKFVNKRSLLIILGLLGLVVVLNMIGDIGPDRPTTYSVGEKGYKAFYLWLQQTGFRTERWTQPLTDLPDEKAMLFIMVPEIPSRKTETDALKAWVERGGTLVVLDSPAGEIVSSFGLRLRYSAAKKPPLRPEKAGLNVRPGPYTEGVNSIEDKSRFVLSSDRPEVIMPIENINGGLMAVMNEGEGKVLAFSSPEIFSNGSLLKKDHARLAYNIIHLSRPGVLLFDEYHHGYGRSVSVFDHFRHSRMLWPFLQLVFAFLLFWAFKGRRFGLPRPVITEKSRSSMEYISAMANLFKQTENRHYILETILKRIKGESRRYLIQGDPDLNRAFERAGKKLKDKYLGDQDLQKEAKNLYQSFYRARQFAPGGRWK